MPCVIVNPATRPSKSLAKYVGKTITNMGNGKPVTVTQEDLDAYSAREQYLANNTNGKLINMFLATDDLVIDPTETLENLPYTSFLELKKNGGHRFEEYWNEVVMRIQSILK